MAAVFLEIEATATAVVSTISMIIVSCIDGIAVAVMVIVKAPSF